MLSSKKTLADLTAADLKDKRVLIRVDYNVPFVKGTTKISNHTRISETIGTLRDVFSKGAKAVILLSHLGRPNGLRDPTASLKPVAVRLQILLNKPITFLNDIVGDEVEKVCSNPKDGEIILLENARFHPEEEGSGVDAEGNKVKPSEEEVAEFRKKLTKLGDVYINDAFGTAHRAHSTMVGIDLPLKVAGFLMAKELKAFIPILESPQKPYLAILGGSKVTDKIKLIKNLLEKVNQMILCGGMAYTFLKVHNFMEIGKSLYDEEGAATVEELLALAKEKGVEILLPTDHLVGNEFKNDCETQVVDTEGGVPLGYAAYDLGPETITKFKETIKNAKTIIWNGPAGVYEFENFQKGTRGMLDAAVEAKTAGAVVVIGGGDCGTCAINWGYAEKLSHVSTGGGASLELLEGREMPGIAALSSK